MRDGEAGFAGPTHRAGSGRAQLGRLFAKRSTLLAAWGSGAPSGGCPRVRRPAAALSALAGAIVLALFLGTVPASAHIQWEPKYTFGPDGTPGTTFGGVTVTGMQQAESKLWVHAGTYPQPSLVYSFHRTGPGELTPLGSPFPLTAHWLGEGEFGVDNTANASKGNAYLALGDSEEVPSIEAWSAAGTVLPAFEAAKGNKCGAAVDPEGHLWVANQGNGLAEVFDPTGGEPIKTVPLKSPQNYSRACNLAFDPSTGDLYAGFDFGNGVYRFTASSNFETKEHVPGSGTGECCQRPPKIAIDKNSNRLYLANSWSCCPSENFVQVFNLTTWQELEKFQIPTETGAISVDEASDTLFLPLKPEGASGQGGKYVQEWRRVNAPLVTTGSPAGNEVLSGSVALDGAGNVTGCWAEYGTNNEPEKFTKSATSCSGTLPYEADQPNVTVDLTGLLEGEKTYYYRIAATNGEGTGRGAIKTFVPHWVSEIKTLPASNEGLEGRTEERLKGSYQGTEEETEYWFEYKEGSGSCGETCPSKTEVKTEGKTTGLTNLSLVAKGLKAGTTYSYRVVAKNARGESKGQMEQFTTLPAVANIVTEEASSPTSTTTRTLNGSLNPEGIETNWYFEWGKDTSYGQDSPLPPGKATSAAGTVHVEEELTELEPGTTYHFRLVATNKFGTTYGADKAFTAPQAPSITSFNAIDLTANSAVLVATINPNGYETDFQFEYGLSKNYDHKAPEPKETLKEVTGVQKIEVPITNLVERTYHFKLIAHNTWGTVETEDQTFNFNVPEACPNQILRQETGSAYLPDCRAYELVSARNANGTALAPNGPTSPYADGKMAYAGFLNVIPGSGEPQNSAFGLEPYMATRTPNGWVTKYIGVPGSVGIGQSSSPGNEYGEVSGYNCWMWEEEQYSCGVQGTFWPSAIPADKFLSHMLVWNREQYGIFGGLKDGNDGPEVYSNEGKFVQKLPTNFDEVEGADTVFNEGGWIGSARISPDYTHYAFSSIKTAFAPGGLTASPGSVYDDNLQTGEVTVVSKTENGEDIPLDPLSGLSEEFLRVPAVSDDGTHILISSAAAPHYGFTKFTQNQHLYMSVDEGNGNYKHWDISVNKSGENVGVEYKSMTPDGSKVFFVTDHQMTADDTDTSRDLYMWSLEAAEEGKPPLTRLSASDNVSGNSDNCSASWTQKCNVKMILIYPGGFSGGNNLFDTYTAAESGEIYFYSPERLDGARGFPNKRNLYVYRNGKAQYVTTLEPNEPVERVDVSPNGAHMAFITKTKVTPYENAGYSEMYLYNPAGRSIKCVSCRPDGEPPTSNVEGSKNGWFMSFDGRTFWSTRDALVPRDANGSIDVYEFTEGRPQLITPGTSNDGETFIQHPGLVGVTADGTDVFFATFATLVSQDENGDQYKFYDARVNGGFPPEPLHPPCAAADECHGEEPPAPAQPEIGSSAALGNGGNYHFAKKHKRKHSKCRKAKKKTCRSKGAGRKRSRHG